MTARGKHLDNDEPNPNTSVRRPVRVAAGVLRPGRVLISALLTVEATALGGAVKPGQEGGCGLCIESLRCVRSAGQ